MSVMFHVEHLYRSLRTYIYACLLAPSFTNEAGYLWSYEDPLAA